MSTSQKDKPQESDPVNEQAVVANRETSQDADNFLETTQPPIYVLPVVVASQLAGTSLWFAGNAILPDLVNEWQNNGIDSVSQDALGYLTSSVQLGFIVGTLVSALLNLPDRFRPTRLFLASALCGAFLNAMIPFWKSLAGLVLLRLGTGICLAGIYPVGMKVAADWFPALGRALGWLVGALCVGSALPYLLANNPQPWEYLLWETSALAALGGLAVGLVLEDGLYRRPGTKLDPSVVWTLFRDDNFRGAAFGYFGHQWELYAFWTYIPTVWKGYIETQEDLNWDENAITFAVLSIGGSGCVLGGFLSGKYGNANVAFVSLWVSGLLCFFSPALYLAPSWVMLVAYLVWGLTVISESPQFSTMVATYAPANKKGTALTIVNCLGYIITIGSIQLLSVPLPEQFLFLLLAPGPLFGLWSMRSLAFSQSTKPQTSRDEDNSYHHSREDTNQEEDAA